MTRAAFEDALEAAGVRVRLYGKVPLRDARIPVPTIDVEIDGVRMRSQAPTFALLYPLVLGRVEALAETPEEY